MEKKLLSPRDRKGKHGRTAERGLVELPHISAGVVLKAVPEENADHVLPLTEGDLVFIVIDEVVGIADVRRKKPSCDPLAVQVKLIKSADGHRDPDGRRLRRKGTAEIVRRHRSFKGTILLGRLDKILF